MINDCIEKYRNIHIFFIYLNKHDENLFETEEHVSLKDKKKGWKLMYFYVEINKYDDDCSFIYYLNLPLKIPTSSVQI